MPLAWERRKSELQDAKVPDPKVALGRAEAEVAVRVRLRIIKSEHELSVAQHFDAAAPGNQSDMVLAIGLQKILRRGEIVLREQWPFAPAPNVTAHARRGIPIAPNADIICAQLVIVGEGAAPPMLEQLAGMRTAVRRHPKRIDVAHRIVRPTGRYGSDIIIDCNGPREFVSEPKSDPGGCVNVENSARSRNSARLFGFHNPAPEPGPKVISVKKAPASGRNRGAAQQKRRKHCGEHVSTLTHCPMNSRHRTGKFHRAGAGATDPSSGEPE